MQDGERAGDLRAPSRCGAGAAAGAPLRSPRPTAQHLGGRSSPQVRRPPELRSRVRSVAPRLPKHRTALAAPRDVAKTEE